MEKGITKMSDAPGQIQKSQKIELGLGPYPTKANAIAPRRPISSLLWWNVKKKKKTTFSFPLYGSVRPPNSFPFCD